VDLHRQQTVLKQQLELLHLKQQQLDQMVEHLLAQVQVFSRILQIVHHSIIVVGLVMSPILRLVLQVLIFIF
jgi:hypothetical protein